MMPIRVPFYAVARLFVASVLAGAIPVTAKAEFTICNQTFDVINTAVALPRAKEFATTGWWTIGPNQCADVIDETLTARYIYVFAQDVFGRVVLSGSFPMCVAPKKFEIPDQADCLQRGYLEARFHEVDTLESERWTLFVYSSGN